MKLSDNSTVDVMPDTGNPESAMSDPKTGSPARSRWSISASTARKPKRPLRKGQEGKRRAQRAHQSKDQIASGRAGKATVTTVPRAGSKIAHVIVLLHRTKGASIPDIVAVTGWQPHTVRAALTGLRKRGLEIVRKKDAHGTSLYHIAKG